MNNTLKLVSVGAVFLALIVAVWAFLDNRRDEDFRETVLVEANNLTSLIDASMRSRIPALQRMAERWELRG